MASFTPNPPNPLPDNKNGAYSQSIYSDDEEILSDHFASSARREVPITPLGLDEDSRPANFNARRTIVNFPVDSRLGNLSFY